VESRIFGKEGGFSGEGEEYLFAGGASGVVDFDDMPVIVGGGGR
jgi:hypothetical protein